MAKDEQAEQDEPGSSQELDDSISSEKSENTVKKTNYEWKKFETFCKEQSNGSFNVKKVPADALDKLPGKFFKDVRKQNGAEYEPDSLSSFQRSIQRRLKELKLSFNILKDEEFCRSREVSAAKRKNLVKQEFTKFKLVQVGLPRSSTTNVGDASTASSSSKFKRSRASFSFQP